MISRLMPQVERAGGLVTVEALWNNGEKSIAWYRQRMLEHANSEYVSFVDDDDEVNPKYVRTIIPWLNGVVEYIGFQVVVGAGGNNYAISYHSITNSAWSDDIEAGKHYRNITHLNPIKRELALKGDFTSDASRAHYGEDRVWSEQVYPHVKIEHYIPEVMYAYLSPSGEGVFQHLSNLPDLGHYRKLAVMSPYFSYHPYSSEDTL